MKKILILLVWSLCSASFGFFKLGIEGGLISSNISNDQSITTNARTGFGGGAALELGLGSDFKLQIESFYAQKGYVLSTTTPQTTAKIDYWEFPVFIKYVLDLPLIHPFIFAGPYFSFKVNAALDNGTGTANTISGLKSTDIGASFGGGAELAISPMSCLFASVRYDLGLTNIIDTTVSPTNATYKNKALIVFGGLLFGF